MLRGRLEIEGHRVASWTAVPVSDQPDENGLISYEITYNSARYGRTSKSYIQHDPEWGDERLNLTCSAFVSIEARKMKMDDKNEQIL